MDGHHFGSWLVAMLAWSPRRPEMSSGPSPVLRDEGGLAKVWRPSFLAILSMRYPLGMSATTTSVFDLSPSEKLQLVEDLWDDIAASPETVPVHDWQMEELARRKANLMQNPASGLSWEEVKRRVRSRYGR